MSVIFNSCMKAKFLGTPIARVESLARTLGVSIHDLRTIAGAASSRYNDFQIDKKDGGKRDVSSPRIELKLIQKRINREIFEKVYFPSYLNGGIKGRDYVKNAYEHGNSETIISLDIENFYPKVSRISILNIFKNFLKQPEEIAEILTNLCTKDNKLPQGGCASSYLANLVFFDIEPRLVSRLQEEGFTYTRLIDDITISSKNLISKKKISDLIESITKMLKSRGFKLKQKKTRCTSASNPEKLMEVTGLWLNRGAPRVRRNERAEIRKEVRECLISAELNKTDKEYHDLHQKVSGRVAKLSQLNHCQAERFRKELREILPIYSDADIRKTRRLVAKIIKTPRTTRSSLGYIKKYHQIVYRINILARSNKSIARSLREKMKICAPTITKENSIHG